MWNQPPQTGNVHCNGAAATGWALGVCLLAACSAGLAQEPSRRVVLPTVEPPLRTSLAANAWERPRAADSSTGNRAQGASSAFTNAQGVRRLPPVEPSVVQASLETTAPVGLRAIDMQGPSAALAAQLPIPIAELPPSESLEAIWRAAISVDQQLQARRWAMDAAADDTDSARRASWPNVVATTGYTVRSDQPQILVRSPLAPQPITSFPIEQSEGMRFKTGVELPLYTSGRISNSVDAAESSLSAEKWRFEAETRELKLQVAGEYYALLRATRDLEVARNGVETLSAHVADTKRLFDQRQVPENDVLAAEVAFANAKQRENEATAASLNCQAAVNRRLGRPYDAPLRLVGPPSAQTTAQEVLSAPITQTASRPEIAELSARIRALDSGAASVLAADLPQLGVQGDYVYEENIYRAPEGIAAAGVVLQWNLYDGGRHRAQARAMTSRSESLRRQQRDLQSQFDLAARQAWLALQEARRRAELALCSVEHADENLRVARERYQAGLATNTEVLDAETLRWHSHQDLYRAECDGALAEVRLRYAQGSL